MNRRTLFVGPPGSGKGTHAKRLSQDFGIPHVATGDMLRREVSEETDLGRVARAIMDAGSLVPDELVLEMVAKRLAQADASRGWILDGFPRTMHQALALEERLAPRGVDVAITLDVPESEIVERVAGRRVCANGHVYHLRMNPPRSPGRCDVDDEPLYQRDDDTEEVIRKRLDLFRRETSPLIEYYRERGALAPVDGTGSLEVVYARVAEVFKAN